MMELGEAKKKKKAYAPKPAGSQDRFVKRLTGSQVVNGLVHSVPSAGI